MTETMSMNRVPQHMPPAPSAGTHDLGLLPPQFAGARGEWPRPRIPCPTCGDEMSLRWGKQRRPHFAHLPGPQRNCSGGGGEGIKHLFAKEGLAQYLEQRTELQFFSHCQICEAKVELGSVPVNERRVEVEHRLPAGGIADIAVYAGEKCEVVIEVFDTHRTATTVNGVSAPSRPEPWYEVRADDVLRMLEANQSISEIECVRLDHGMCPKCGDRQKKRVIRGQWTLKVGKHKGKTFEEASSDTVYVKYLLVKLVEGQFWHMAEELDPYARLGKNKGLWIATIAFELPQGGEYMSVYSLFRNGELKESSLVDFAEYLVNEPDLYAIEAKESSKIDLSSEEIQSMAPWDLQYYRTEIVTAKKRAGPYRPGTNLASEVTVVRFDSKLENWTAHDDDVVVDVIKPAAPSTPKSVAVGLNRQDLSKRVVLFYAFSITILGGGEPTWCTTIFLLSFFLSCFDKKKSVSQSAGP